MNKRPFKLLDVAYLFSCQPKQQGHLTSPSSLCVACQGSGKWDNDIRCYCQEKKA